MLKRIVLFALALCTLFTLCACDRKDKRDIFFDSATLEKYTLEDIPVPNIANSRLRTDTLYLNLSDERTRRSSLKMAFFAKSISTIATGGIAKATEGNAEASALSINTAA